MERRQTVRQKVSSAMRSSALAAPDAAYHPHQVSDAYDFDLSDIDVQDIRYMNRIHQGIYENKFHRHLSSMIALNGVKAAASGDVETINKLLTKVTEFASTTSVRTLDLIKTCNSDGFNMFHAAVIYKRMEVMHMILQYGTEVVSVPTDDDNEDTPLILAIKHFTSFVNPMNLSEEEGVTNLDVVANLIQFGADVNAANKKGNTPLIYAVKCQLLDVVDLLVKAETFNSVDACNSNGSTALCYAAAFDNYEIAGRLLSLKANVFAIGNIAVHAACKYGSEKVLQLLLETNRDHVRRLVRETDKDGNTPLMLAKSALTFSSKNIELLIACGSNLLAFNHEHNRILHFYCSTDDKDINENILQKEPTLLSHKNYDLETPLHVVAKYGHKDTCFLYAEKGADIYAKDAIGNTPMMNAIIHGHKEIVMIFFNFDYSVDIIVKRDKMLLEWAIEQGHITLIEALTESNPSGVIDNYYNGATLIHHVCKLGNVPILQHLLYWDNANHLQRCTTKPNSPLGNGYHPFHVAVSGGHLECVKLLCKFEYDLKVRTSQYDDTPLHIAARDGHLEIVKYLLTQGIDTEVVNYKEGTPLSSAASAGQYHVVAYLLAVGASANGSIDRYHLKTTPLLLACKEGHDKVVKRLLEDTVNVSVASEEGNCLMVAILSGHRRTALTILNSKYWKKALQFRGKKNETPMRLLIQHMPDVAEVALHHCVHREYTETEKGGSEVSKIEYSFEFLDDFMTPVPTMSMYLNMLPWRKTNQANQFEDTMDRDSARDVPLKPIPTVQGPPYLAVSSPVDSFENPINGCEGEESWLQEKFDPQNHPLELMVKYKRTSLLLSPVVEEMRTRKWKTYGLPAFVANMIVYTLFLVMFTALILVTPFPQEDKCNIPGCWSSWRAWSSCNLKNGCANLNGTRSRTRMCINGNFGKGFCEGNKEETEECAAGGPSLVITRNPMDKVAMLNDTANFTCAINGATEIEWYDENGLLHPGGDINITSNVTEDAYISNLILMDITNDSFQTYTCNGSDEDATVSASAVLTMNDSCHSDCLYQLRNIEQIRGGNCNGVLSSSAESYIYAADVLIILFSFVQLILEAFQFWSRKLEYLTDFENWLEVLIFMLSMAFAIGHLKLECFCPDKLVWSLGILAIFLGWMNHVIFLRRLPYTGITISILYNIFSTFFELILIAALLVFAFALPFYMLLTIPNRRTPFSNIGRSMLKTLVMTTGEFEFDTIFINEQELVDEGLSLFLPEITSIMWVMFIIVMPILFSNLLVGLAVGDTQEERAKAQLTKISLQVRLILELEDTMSNMRLRYYARSTGRSFTSEHSWYDFLLGTTKLERREAQLAAWEQQENFIKVQQLLKTDPVHEIQETLNQQKQSLHNMHNAFMERIQHLEDEISVYFRNRECQENAQQNEKALMKRQPLNLRHTTSTSSTAMRLNVQQ